MRYNINLCACSEEEFRAHYKLVKSDFEQEENEITKRYRILELEKLEELYLIRFKKPIASRQTHEFAEAI